MPKANSVGALVNQLLEQVQSGADLPAGVVHKNVHIVQQATLSVNGKQYENLEQLPPNLRQAVRQGLAIAEGMRHGSSPRVATTMSVDSNEFSTMVGEPTDGSKPRQGRLTLVVIVGAVALLLLAALVAVLFVQ